MENLFIEAIAKALGWEPEDVLEVRLKRIRGSSEFHISVLKAPKSSMVYMTIQKGTLKMPGGE